MEERVLQHSILWRSILQTGHEICQLYSNDSGWALHGTALFLHEANPCILNYRILCDESWKTLSAGIQGWVGNEQVNFQIRTDDVHRWWLNYIEIPAVSSCIDLDFHFSPSTNLLPIRRLGLQVGEKADITAAWLKFPSFTLEPLPQQYERLGEHEYKYSSRNGEFVADLRTNSAGFVTDYPGIWVEESG